MSATSYLTCSQLKYWAESAFRMWFSISRRPVIFVAKLILFVGCNSKCTGQKKSVLIAVIRTKLRYNKKLLWIHLTDHQHTTLSHKSTICRWKILSIFAYAGLDKSSWLRANKPIFISTKRSRGHKF
jgi:hypothetical protein